jgi:hypothetical protein
MAEMIEVKGNGCMVEQLPLPRSFTSPFVLPDISCERETGRVAGHAPWRRWRWAKAGVTSALPLRGQMSGWTERLRRLARIAEQHCLPMAIGANLDRMALCRRRKQSTKGDSEWMRPN